MNQPSLLSTAVERHGSLSRARSKPRVSSFSFIIISLILFHLLLALAMSRFTAVATAHALCTFALGVFFLAVDRNPVRLIYLAAYIMGAELLWRMTKASIFWEFGKYSIAFLLILAIFKYNRLIRADKKPFIYFILLLPSILQLAVFDRQAVAFNLSGPFSLAIATMFFSTIKLSRPQIGRVLLALLTPIISTAFLATFTTMTATSLSFSPRGSSFATSGYIGPNQMSSVLGLGALAAFLYAILDRQHRFLRVLMFGSTLWMAAQSVLTFSRGGFLTALGALAVAGFYLLRDRRTRLVFLTGGIVLFMASYFLIFPVLNKFTGGTIAARFASLNPTGREKVIQGDLAVFLKNPLLGVGPGQSRDYRYWVLNMPGGGGAHTEYTRMLSEHGSLGLLALIIFIILVWKRVRIKLPPFEKACAISFTAWSLLFMAHAAMRLVAPSFLFGLAIASMPKNRPQRNEKSI